MKDHNKMIEKHLKNKFNITVDIDSEWEGVLLSHEEIDTQLIPEEELKNLPDPALFHMTNYIGGKGGDWLVALVSHPEDVSCLYYALCILNGELFTSWIPNLKDK